MVTGICIPSEIGTTPTVRSFDSLADYQAVVGGYIEPVELPLLGVTIYVNEEGLMRALSPNSRATALWWFWSPQARRGSLLCGDAVVVGATNGAGESTDLPEDLMAIMTGPGTFHINAQMGERDDWTQLGRQFDSYFEACYNAVIVDESIRPRQLKVVSHVDRPN